MVETSTDRTGNLPLLRAYCVARGVGNAVTDRLMTPQEYAERQKRYRAELEKRLGVAPIELTEPAPRKYRNKPTNGYASKKEARRAAELKLLQAAGTIAHLREQVRYELIPKQVGPNDIFFEHALTYTADFVYVDSEGFEVVEDVKGHKTKEYVIKRKLMLFLKGIRIKEL